MEYHINRTSRRMIFVPLQCILSRKKTSLKDVDYTENSLTANFQQQRKML